jgi:prepilin-type N-terminal cleavage/methylation domain-containing protein
LQTHRHSAFTLFEVLIAMGVFALAFMGLAIALDSAISAGIETRDAANLRAELESRMAYCQAIPPPPGAKRNIAAKDNRGIAIEEKMEPFLVKNEDGEELQNLWLLTIKAEANGITETAETVVYQQ